MPALNWLLLGIGLIVGEMLTGGFFLLFLALGSFAAAGITLVSADFLTQGLAGSGIAILGILFLRKPIQKKLLKTTELPKDIGQEITLDAPIPVGKQARITYQGTTWEAINEDSSPLLPGDRAVIHSINGNVLLLKKSKKQ